MDDTEYKKILATVPFTREWIEKGEEFVNKVYGIEAKSEKGYVFKTKTFQDIYDNLKVKND